MTTLAHWSSALRLMWPKRLSSAFAAASSACSFFRPCPRYFSNASSGRLQGEKWWPVCAVRRQAGVDGAGEMAVEWGDNGQMLVNVDSARRVLLHLLYQIVPCIQQQQ